MVSTLIWAVLNSTSCLGIGLGFLWAFLRVFISYDRLSFFVYFLMSLVVIVSAINCLERLVSDLLYVKLDVNLCALTNCCPVHFCTCTFCYTFLVNNCIQFCQVSSDIASWWTSSWCRLLQSIFQSLCDVEVTLIPPDTRMPCSEVVSTTP